MDSELHKKYENIRLTLELRNMYADILENDQSTRRTLIAIAKETAINNNFGINIHQLSKLVKVDRFAENAEGQKVKKEKYIDKKLAERTVDKLLCMGLCYYTSMPPYKMINLTVRGKEVLHEINQRKESKKGDAEHV